MNPSRTPAVRGRRIVSIVRELSTWCPPADAVRDLLTHMGAYTDVLLESWNVEGPTDAAIAWTDPYTLPADTIELFHEKGIRVMVLAGGEQGGPAWALHSAADYASALAQFVSSNSLDGVNLAFHGRGWDHSDPRSEDELRRSDWICEVTGALRRALPTKSISHACDAPCFGPGDRARLRRIHARVGEDVDFYVVRYCGPQGSDYLDSGSVFSAAPRHVAGTALDELVAAGFPVGKLVLGKPVSREDGPGYIELARLANMLRARVEGHLPLGGVCGWYWASDRKVLAGSWSTTVARAMSGEQRGE